MLEELYVRRSSLVFLASLFLLRFLLWSALLFLFLHGFVNNLHEILLECLLLQHESVLIPNVVRHLGVPPVLAHAPFEQSDDVGVVRLLSELEFATVVHEIFEFVRVTFAKLLYGDFELLLFDVGVLFVLGATGETLPR